ncbi:MAG: hypothetical protein AVDCRST_MAG67-1122 [uncultured Solirubrobacteraceae bacterium]|uniref:Uncharacterized protein n=1 Tax=uncultured Solirubrobacteraceae bacterium TaxID=1162706 RepID=A0A6J4S2F7_9ACTN|nr:MAG: hypothetical protein AVDCRST_MAG67-1122 [uncultured Solirubrobacteraceae bacterium]
MSAVAAFRQRPLEGAHPYLWLDAKLVKVPRPRPRSPRHMQGFHGAEGGTRNPDTRIMMAPKSLVLQAVWEGRVGLGRAGEGQICRVGDIVGDTVERSRRDPARRLTTGL